MLFPGGYMLGIIRIGDKTTHGGAVQSGSAEMIFGGIGVAPKGEYSFMLRRRA